LKSNYEYHRRQVDRPTIDRRFVPAVRRRQLQADESNLNALNLLACSSKNKSC